MNRFETSCRGRDWEWSDSSIRVVAPKLSVCLPQEVINEGGRKEFPCSPKFSWFITGSPGLTHLLQAPLMVVLRLFFPLGCLPAWNWSSFSVNSEWLVLRNGNFTIFSPCCSKESPLNDGFTTSFPLPSLFANAETGHSPVNSRWPVFLPYPMTEITAQHNSGDNSLCSTLERCMLLPHGKPVSLPLPFDKGYGTEHLLPAPQRTSCSHTLQPFSLYLPGWHSSSSAGKRGPDLTGLGCPGLDDDDGLGPKEVIGLRPRFKWWWRPMVLDPVGLLWERHSCNHDKLISLLPLRLFKPSRLLVSFYAQINTSLF